MNVDLYAVLGIDQSASAGQVKSAYRRLARAYHPDRNPAPDAAKRFKAIAEAYAVLSDSARRQAYDRWGQDSTQDSMRQSDELTHARPHPDADTAFE